MIKRRAKVAGLPTQVCAHSFHRYHRVPAGQQQPGDSRPDSRHASTRTTQLYNRLPDEVSLDEIERIHI